MSNIQNQKSGLAKLMATENLIVQHAKVPTAMFDPKNRVLTCPIWEQMSGDLYDLLMGHEVGHAIDTPADGWHGAVHERGANYKGFLNVVEDARIEKRQKRRYPGLRRSFVNGFNELMAKDFFGLAGRNVNSLPFIDRLNIYSKSGYTIDVAFNVKEQDFVDRVQACETWDDVLKVTNEIWDYSKEEQSQTNIPQDNFEYDENGEEAETESGSNEGDAETDGQGEKEAKSKNKGDDGDQEKESSSGANQDGEEEGDGGEDKDGVNRFKESQSVNQDQSSEPRCETDENFRDNEGKLIAKKAREYVYIDIPTPNLKKIVTPAKRVQEVLTEEFSKQRPSEYQSVANTLYSDFRRKNERFISLLAKEFEMRKAADKFSKAKTSSTGDIDVSRVFKYQIDDNIFKKVMRVPKGKSHGLILLLDKSGSMSENLGASYEQILVLATFCRKVNIPFAAYGFGNADHVRETIDFKEEPGTGRSYDCFTEKNREMYLSSVYLREMINSKMSNSEFSKATKNILCLMNAWSGGRYSRGSNFYRPNSDSLSNTPLTEAMIACQSIIKEFRTVNNLDIVNLCVVHDGDADEINSYHNTNDDSGTRNFFNASYQNVFLCDKKNKIQQEVPEGEDGIRIAISKWLAKTTGVKIIGFYLSPNYNMKNALRRRLFNDEINELRKAPRENFFQLKETYAKYMKLIRKDKFLESKNSGYESFFILPGGGDLSIEDEDFEAPTKVTTSTLTKAFSKYTKNRQVNRVLVSRFISMIAV
jgi:hypothetical protein